MDDNKHGGPGRPAELTDGKRLNVYLDGPTLELAAALGGGNVSLGIRRALEDSPPNTLAARIAGICKRHILLAADRFVDDVQELLTAAPLSCLNDLQLERDVLEQIRERKSFEFAAVEARLELYPIYDEYIVTNWAEVKDHLESIGWKLEYDGIFHIYGSAGEEFEGAEFEDLLKEWLGGENDFYPVRGEPAEAWEDACTRHSLTPVLLKPVRFFIVSNALATALSEEGEIVSDDIMGYRIWGCLTEVHNFADVPVLKRIALDRQVGDKLLGLPKNP
ncbi:hypothetical protein [Cupriavidus sp. PET2-C1]